MRVPNTPMQLDSSDSRSPRPSPKEGFAAMQAGKTVRSVIMFDA
jgi:hypothetical protein